MRVALFHPRRLPPLDYGGIERVVLWLCKGLVQRGHEVFVAALAGSELPKGARLIDMRSEASTALDLLSRLPPGVELVHFMAPPLPEAWQRLPCPGVLTVHGNGRPKEIFPLNSIFLSQNHARRHGATAYVYNGIDPNDYLYEPSRKGKWNLFLSKTSWKVKNVRAAIRLCARARVPLRVAGGSRPWLDRFRVHLHPQMTWEGPVGDQAKALLLTEARALLFPVQWEEPFGLVVVEALMSGTPVLASSRGSLPELIPSRVGALPQTEEEWIDLLQRPTLPWDPEACREWALEKFHFGKMAEEYERMYKKAIQGMGLNLSAPMTGD